MRKEREEREREKEEEGEPETDSGGIPIRRMNSEWEVEGVSVDHLMRGDWNAADRTTEQLEEYQRRA